jgi:hypothetical protein
MTSKDHPGDFGSAEQLRSDQDSKMLWEWHFNSQQGMDDEPRVLRAGATLEPGDASGARIQLPRGVKGTDVAMEELHAASGGPGGPAAPFMMENGEILRRGIVSPRDSASGQATGVTGDSVWDDTDIAHVLQERGFTGSDEELGALIAWMRSNNLIDTSTGEIVWADEAQDGQSPRLQSMLASLQERGIFTVNTGEIVWADEANLGAGDAPFTTVSMLNNKNPELIRYEPSSYIGETEKNLDLVDDDGPATLLGALGTETHAAPGVVDGADFLVWQRGISGDGVDADDTINVIDEPGEVDIDI